MPTIAPWLQPTNTVQASSAGSSAGARLRAIREQAKAALLRHAASMAALRERAREFNATQALRNRALAQETGLDRERLQLAGERLREDARQADLLARYNEGRLGKQGSQAKRYTVMNTPSGPARFDNTTGEWQLMDIGQAENPVIQFLGGQGGAEGATNAPPAAATNAPPASAALTRPSLPGVLASGTVPSSNPGFAAAGVPTVRGRSAPTPSARSVATNVANPAGFRLLSTNETPQSNQLQRILNELDPLNLGIGQ